MRRLLDSNTLAPPVEAAVFIFVICLVGFYAAAKYMFKSKAEVLVVTEPAAVTAPALTCAPVNARVHVYKSRRLFIRL